MKIGQRINLIKKLAKYLGELTWSEGDFILRQFSLPWTDMWQGSGGQEEYFFNMIERGEEAQLVDLHEYLSPMKRSPE